jgi:hypothetical protein
MAVDTASTRKWIVATGLAVGVAIGAAGIANAASSTTSSVPPAGTPTSSATAPQCHSNEDPAHEKGESAQQEADEHACRGPFAWHRGFGHDETPVTGANADKAKAAALEAVPGTVERVGQRADGTYEVHVIKSDGSEVHVLLDKSFKVTGTETGRLHRFGHGPWGGHAPWGGHGSWGGDGPWGDRDGGAPQQQPSGTPSA